MQLNRITGRKVFDVSYSGHTATIGNGYVKWRLTHAPDVNLTAGPAGADGEEEEQPEPPPPEPPAEPEEEEDIPDPHPEPGDPEPINPFFCELFNIHDHSLREELKQFKTMHVFHNVWDRRDLFIHGSFVTSSAQGYLGRHGEFYTQPNKIYYTDFPTKQFYLEVSFDGFRPVELPYENFIVELIFLIDEEEHVGR
jgi:hypothetical protein